MRIWVWLAILALALLGRWEHSDAVTAAIVPIALLFLGFASPRALRGAIVVIALVEAAAWGFGSVGLMIDLLPAAIAAFVGWLFARSLRPPRTPLIERAIAAIDGDAYLRDAAVLRYARRLTLLWAIFQFALVAMCLLCVLHERSLFPWPPLPPRLFGATILPLAVAALFFGEFLLRRYLLPQVPRHTLIGFLGALGRAWPKLIEE